VTEHKRGANGRLADGMDRYHTHFRYEFNRVYDVGLILFLHV
jgi:hypothetical protein